MPGTEKRCKVIREYDTPYPDSIPFKKGESVIVKKEYTEDPDWKDWLWCEGEHDNAAWVPRQYLDRVGDRGVLLRDYDARELSVKAGDILVALEILNGFAMVRNSQGTTGWVPLNVLEEI